MHLCGALFVFVPINIFLVRSQNLDRIVKRAPDNKYVMMCNYGHFDHEDTDVMPTSPEYVPPNLCTHIIFHVARIVEYKIEAGSDRDEHYDGNVKLGLYTRIMGLKKDNQKLKIYLAVSGRLHPYNFEVISTPEKQKTFAESVTNYLKKWSFDGLVFNMRYSDHQPKFHTLCKFLKEWFEKNGKIKGGRLELLAAMDERTIENIGDCLDYLILSTYDFIKRWPADTIPPDDVKTAIKAPLPKIKEMVKQWLDKGVPASKLIVGVSTFGRSFTLEKAEKHGVGDAVVRHGTPGEYSRVPGFFHYYEICYRNVREHWDEEWDDASLTPYSYQKDQWITYDNILSMNEKVAYVKSAKLGGVCVWEITQDDMEKMCSAGRYPLVRALHKGLLGEDYVKYGWKPPKKLGVTPLFGHTMRYGGDDTYEIEFQINMTAPNATTPSDASVCSVSLGNIIPVIISTSFIRY